MPNPRAFKLAARLASATSVLMFGLIVVGSIVRTTGSGLSCPDWPLCHGQLIPPFQFNILIEWLHRLIALLLGVLLAATTLAVMRTAETRARLAGLVALAIALFFTQALLGALTVWKLLDPSVVSAHLAVALLLFSTMVTTAFVASLGASPAPAAAAPAPPGVLPLFGVTTFLVWFQAVVGGMVSTNHAGLACPDWPTCNGEWFPPLVGLVGLQALHRLGAYALTVLLVLVSIRAGRLADPAARTIGRLMPAMTIVQIGLGVANVRLGLPVWVSALHLANAAAILALSLLGTLRLAGRPAAAPALAEAAAR